MIKWIDSFIEVYFYIVHGIRNMSDIADRPIAIWRCLSLKKCDNRFLLFFPWLPLRNLTEAHVIVRCRFLTDHSEILVISHFGCKRHGGGGVHIDFCYQKFYVRNAVTLTWKSILEFWDMLYKFEMYILYNITYISMIFLIIMVYQLEFYSWQFLNKQCRR